MGKEIGPWAGIDIIKGWTNEEFAGFKAESGQFFDQYRKEITGAGATDAERKDLGKNQPTVKDPPGVYAEKLKRTLEIGQAIIRRRASMLNQKGYDAQPFLDELDIDAQGGKADSGPALPPGIPKGSVLEVQQTRDGKRMKVYRSPDNQFFSAE
jgi:hypothetical protein